MALTEWQSCCLFPPLQSDESPAAPYWELETVRV